MSLLVFNFTCWIMVFSPGFHYSTLCFGKRWPWSWGQDKDIDREVTISILVAWHFHSQSISNPYHIFHSHKDVMLTCLLIWLDLSFQSKKRVLLFFPHFCCLFLLPQLNTLAVNHQSFFTEICILFFLHWATA